MLRRLLIILLLAVTGAANAMEREYAVKAAFVFNILKFSQLPNSDLRSRDQGLLMCVLDAPFMLTELRKIAGRPIRNGNLKVTAIGNLGELPLCDAVLVGDSWSNQLDAVIFMAAEHKVLTLTEDADAVRAGLMVGIVPAGSRLAIEINVPATRAAGIRLSAELLRLSRLVQANEVRDEAGKGTPP